MIVKIQEIITATINKLFPKMEIPSFSIEPADEKYGDYSTNLAMVLAKNAGEKPVEIAQKIADDLKSSEMFSEVLVAGPGFINFKIALPEFQNQIKGIIRAGERFGESGLGQNLKVDVEFISANPTGPLTVGNSRGGVIGDVLSNILAKNGWQVTREYYFNDKGGQIDILGHSILKDAEAQYKGEYIDELAKKVEGSGAREVGEKAAQILIDEIKKTTAEMGVNFDVWFAEGKDLRDKGKIDEIITWLKEKDLTYEKEGALWFRSTIFGDDKDRVLLKSDSEPTYFALDCAYHKNKFVERKFDKCINIWGADHHGDVGRVRGFVTALGYDEKFDILIHQFVRIMAGGKEVRMSKRAGNFVLVEDILKEVGRDVYRFFMLQYAPDSHLIFDLDLAKEQSQKNPVFYVQYAYARIHSILAKSSVNGEQSTVNLELLTDPAEIALIKQLIKLPELVQEIAGDYQIQKLPFYARDVAKSFHNFYENCPVIKSGDDNLTAARLTLLKATQIVLKNTLDLIGVSAPEKM